MEICDKFPEDECQNLHARNNDCIGCMKPAQMKFIDKPQDEKYCEDHEVKFYDGECPYCIRDKQQDDDDNAMQEKVDEWERNFDGGL